ncbi:hypothetical protein UFOVP9_3 [uncultured Caudovirales phage]|jgi:hypothetical protein|uniref:Uncharacterized protein n=1 Tax=uncultured Caudovirales phage TaxID=2100421 RepID=A0A6J5KI86_9CAUD|nr:hypothetical protein UFOVP9_3 [uncultured Caudovirales phage]
MWSLIHIAVMASLMLAGAIFIPVFVVVESGELAVTVADDIDTKLDEELKGDDHGN